MLRSPPLDMGSHNPPPSGPSILIGTRFFRQSMWDLTQLHLISCGNGQWLSVVFYPPSPCLWQMPLAKGNYCGFICVHEDNSMAIHISGMWTNPLFLFILYFAHFKLPTNIDMFCYNLSELQGPKEFAQPCLLAFSCDFSHLSKALESIFVTKPWVVPWTAKTIVQVMLLWVASFWVIGSWIIPIIAHTAGYRKEFMTYRGQALYSLLTDVVEGLTGMAILHRCLSRFHPLPQGWFNFRFEGKWQFDVGLGCLMFPLVNRLSQVNLNLLPVLPSAPVTVSSVEQSIIARDPVAMALYAVVVSVCAPIWEEIVFRGFLLPSLTKYMPVWCSILVSSVAFALVHFNMQRMLPLILLGVVMGSVYARTRNLLPSMLLHSLWNAFVFLDLMK